MGACKSCGEIYGVLDLENGICKKCRGQEPKKVEQILKSNNEEKIKKPSNKLAISLIIFGVIIGLIGLFLDTTVQTGMGRVHNLGLMNLQSNLILLAGILLVIGVLLLLFKSKNTENTTTTPLTSSEQLIKLGEMYEKGLISKEEFESQKAKL